MLKTTYTFTLSATAFTWYPITTTNSGFRDLSSTISGALEMYKCCTYIHAGSQHISRKKIFKARMILNTFNLSTWEAGEGRSLQVWGRPLIHRVSFRVLRATQRKSVSRKQTTTKMKWRLRIFIVGGVPACLACMMPWLGSLHCTTVRVARCLLPQHLGSRMTGISRTSAAP